jgi:hypothetical protein
LFFQRHINREKKNLAFNIKHDVFTFPVAVHKWILIKQIFLYNYYSLALTAGHIKGKVTRECILIEDQASLAVLQIANAAIAL